MSSHHVIRDEQEPPVIVLCDNFDIDIVNDLLGWSPLLIVDVELLHLFDTRKIKVDAILKNTLSESSNVNGPRELILSEMEKIDYQKILQILGNKAYTGVNIFCSAYQREYLIKSLMLQEENLTLPMAIFVGKEKTVVIPSNRYSKWYAAEQKLLFNSKSINVTPNIDFGVHFNQIRNEAKYVFTSEKAPIVLTEL